MVVAGLRMVVAGLRMVVAGLRMVVAGLRMVVAGLLTEPRHVTDRLCRLFETVGQALGRVGDPRRA